MRWGGYVDVQELDEELLAVLGEPELLAAVS